MKHIYILFTVFLLLESNLSCNNRKKNYSFSDDTAIKRSFMSEYNYFKKIIDEFQFVHKFYYRDTIQNKDVLYKVMTKYRNALITDYYERSGKINSKCISFDSFVCVLNLRTEVGGLIKNLDLKFDEFSHESVCYCCTRLPFGLSGIEYFNFEKDNRISHYILYSQEKDITLSIDTTDTQTFRYKHFNKLENRYEIGIVYKSPFMDSVINLENYIQNANSYIIENQKMDSLINVFCNARNKKGLLNLKQLGDRSVLKCKPADNLNISKDCECTVNVGSFPRARDYMNCYGNE